MTKHERLLIALMITLVGHQVSGDMGSHMILLAVYAWYVCYVTFIAKR